jgi:predicted small lipoprotein YifL
MVVDAPSALARAWQSLYGAARIGEFVVISNYRLTSSGWAVILLSVTALALGGCGRKAGLDLPPNAPQMSAAPATADTEAERAAQPSVFNSTYGSEAAPAASKGRKKPFILDPLLGN